MIDLVSARAPRPEGERKPPVLFVPGAYSGAWIWRDTFFPAFREAGHDVHAMSFRAHGRRGWRLHRLGLRDFAEDLRMAIERIPRPPAIVAHSLGGRVALKLLESMTLPCAMLPSPVPPHGLMRSMLALGARSPLSVAKLVGVAVEPRISTLGAPPLGIYSDSADPRRAEEITGRLQAESLRALCGALAPGRIDLDRIATPVHLYGAEGDHLIPPREVRRAARALDAPVTVFPGMSHSYQAEREWRTVAEAMLGWLAETTRAGARAGRESAPTVRGWRKRHRLGISGAAGDG